MFQAKVVEKIKTHILCFVKFRSPPHDRSVYELKWKDIVAADRPQMNGAYALHAGHARLQVHTQNM